MKNIIATTVFIGLILGFSGCIGTYSLSPSYNKNTRVLKIDGVEFKNVTEKNDIYVNSAMTSRAKSKTNYASYNLSNEGYSYLNYRNMSAGHATYIGITLGDIIEADAKKGKTNCNVVKVSDLKFYNCNRYKNNTYKVNVPNYTIIGTTPSQYEGYSAVETIFTNKKAFFDILNHFKNKAKEDNIEVKNYTLGTNPPKNSFN